MTTRILDDFQAATDRHAFSRDEAEALYRKTGVSFDRLPTSDAKLADGEPGWTKKTLRDFAQRAVKTRPKMDLESR